MKRVVLSAFVLLVASVSFLSCGYSKSGYYKPPSGLSTRVVVSQDVNATTTLGGLFILNGKEDVYARASEISAGANPGMMTLSPTRNALLVFDSNSKSIQVINTVTETNIGSVPLPGNTTSFVLPDTTTLGYAAVPTTPINGYPPGAVFVLNLSAGTTLPIGVPNAQTVLSNPAGTQLLVFSNDSDSISVLSPLIAIGPIEQGCDNPSPNGVCTVVPGFNRPVGAIWGGGTTAYILNCGQECGGSQPASIQILDLSTTPPTAGASVAVDGATVAFSAGGSSVYVAGNSPTQHDCGAQTTAATNCGRLDIVDLGSMSVTSSIPITDGYHDHMDMSMNGQLFIGSHACTNIGDVNAPNGEVRGCLTIFNSGDSSVVIPPDNGNVTGLQGFATRNVEYVVQGGVLRIYDTTKDILQTTQIAIVGQVVDVKAIDFF